MQTYHPVFSVSKRANICKRLMKLYFATLPNPGLLGFCRGTRMYLVRKLFPRPWRHVQELIMQQFLTRILHIGILLQLAAKKMNIWMFFRKNYVKPSSDFEIKTDFINIFSIKGRAYKVFYVNVNYSVKNSTDNGKYLLFLQDFFFRLKPKQYKNVNIADCLKKKNIWKLWKKK